MEQQVWGGRLQVIQKPKAILLHLGQVFRQQLEHCYWFARGPMVRGHHCIHCKLAPNPHRYAAGQISTTQATIFRLAALRRHSCTLYI